MYNLIISHAVSGFGHHLAVKLESLGCVVYAGCLFPGGDGARTLREMKSKRLHVLHLDVTDDSHVSNAVDYVEKHSSGTFEPHHEKTCLRGFRPGPTQTRLYSHRRWLEA